jgi:peptide/nickel transport system ATP-binding protein
MTVRGSTASESESDENILEVRDASVTFNMDRGESEVLQNVSLDIKEEEILGVVGESGSGKSMFASALLDAVVEPGVLTGEVTYRTDGRQIDILELDEGQLSRLRWEEISMVFQGALSSFNPTMDVRGHFAETLRYHNYSVEDGLEHARELLAELYLDPDRVLESYPHELSGGMKQRALIALSLVLRPNILVMDEPTAALDLLMQRSILSLIENLKEKYDLTVVFITHDLPLVAGLADRLAVMYAFEFAEIGDADRITSNPRHPYTRALLRAVPSLDLPLSMMRPIKGSSPDPVNVPSGCSYHPRCPLSDSTCENTNPPLEFVEDNHVAACHYWEDADDAVPLERDTAPEDEFVIEGTQSEDPVLSLNDLEVHFEETSNIFESLFSDPDIVRAVDGVNLDIYENDVVALVGESGCGKTTLGKAAIALQNLTDGTIEYRGQDIAAARENQGDVKIPFGEIRRSLQIIHQDPGSSLNPNRTVEASLTGPMKRWYPDTTPDDLHDSILGMLERVGMTPARDYAQRYPHQLSGGEKQRVALVRALLMRPDVILADEAISALDVSLRVGMMDLMLEMLEEFNTSYLFISHNLSNARYFAAKADGRIGVMYLGQIVEIGPAEEIINDPQHPYTKVLKWSTASLEEEEASDPPIRGIDIPDPIDPPSGCHFHTRCPEAREVCTREAPTLVNGSGDHSTACFREYDEDHPYWDSDPLQEDDEAEEAN